MKVSIKSLVEQVVKEEINKLDSPTNNDKPLKEENAYNLKKGEVYTWTMGAGPLKVKYLGKPSENPEIKPSVSIGKGYLFQFIDTKSNETRYVEVGPQTVQKYVQTNEATTTMVTPDGKTLSPEQKAKMKMAKPGTTVIVKKAGELSEGDDVISGFYAPGRSEIQKNGKVKLIASSKEEIEALDFIHSSLEIECGSGNYSKPNNNTLILDKKDTCTVNTVSYISNNARGVSGVRVPQQLDELIAQVAEMLTSEDDETPEEKAKSAQSAKWAKMRQQHKDNPGKYIVKEGKDKKEAPAENPEAPAEEAPVEDQTAGTASSELNQHISAAIDSAAKAIEASQDAKYEKVLGKVIKNLTAAQASLADVEAVENKLNEQKLKEETKVADSFRKNLRKELKSSFKNPEHIDLILKKYDKVAKTASKENRPVQKIAEIITRHALNEGLIKKGDLLS